MSGSTSSWAFGYHCIQLACMAPGPSAGSFAPARTRTGAGLSFTRSWKSTRAQESRHARKAVAEERPTERVTIMSSQASSRSPPVVLSMIALRLPGFFAAPANSSRISPS
ncbi:hypothetical protein [Streptomyces yangpuensis]|uniref:hypothetical protein n=1 Tax=Streptomyces yangpuensis TaxID=1648182 RepID=UPI00062904CC|nr:hypothetical protein [Streptomyces yangpuensis]